jgi:RNA polymerase sigma-70 factor, ECF subfamily
VSTHGRRETAPAAESHDRRARRDAFERLALPHSGALFRTARRLIGAADDASDVVQETFLRAYRTFDSFREGTNAKAWLFTILYSIVSNKWRRDRRTPAEVSFDEIEGRFERALAAPGTPADVHMAAALGSSREVESALEGLPDVYRDAVLLVDVEELTYDEAAQALGCPIGTVRSRVARARKLLYVALREYAVRTGALRDGQ